MKLEDIMDCVDRTCVLCIKPHYKVVIIMANLVTITFLPTYEQIRVPIGTSLLEAANEAGVQINAVCGGKGSCGKCRAKLLKGSLSEVSSSEKRLFSQQQLQEGFILLCQKSVLEDTEIENLANLLPNEAYTPAKGNLLDLTFEVDTPVSKVFHQLTVPSIEDQVADLDRILNEHSSLIKVDFELIKEIPSLLRRANYRVTSVVVNNDLIALEEGDTTAELYGIAFDIGTTSVAGYLVNMIDGKVLASASATNRQGIHGADVISRIAYTNENKEGGLTRLQTLVSETLDDVVVKLLQRTGVSKERVYTITLIGNTVMSHLLMAVSPIGMATAPFIPGFARSLSGCVRNLGLKCLVGSTRFVLLPNIAGYVGSDTVGVILATQLDRLAGTWLAVDIGTNGEIALASGSRLLTCSTAAGPAFEGASISQGMRAEPGAIVKVDIDEDVHLEVVGNVEPLGICGSGLIDAVAELLRLGVIRSNGRIRNPEECPALLSDAVKNRIRQTEKNPKFVLYDGKQHEVAITQKDISELQLGKGAVRAGIELLMKELDIEAHQLDGILVAGAFGSNLRPESVKGIGLFPNIRLSKIIPVGNAAGTGAIMALLSKTQLQKANDLPKRVEHVELSLNKGFSQSFAKAISFQER